MAPDPSTQAANRPAARTGRHGLQLSHWINEPLPDLRLILSGHDVSRLTRRPRWLLIGLALLGRFPKQRRYHGRPVGWHRSDILDWLSHGLSISAECPSTPRRCPRRHPRQSCLPLECRIPCAAAHESQPPDGIAARPGRTSGRTGPSNSRERLGHVHATEG